MAKKGRQHFSSDFFKSGILDTVEKIEKRYYEIIRQIKGLGVKFVFGNHDMGIKGIDRGIPECIPDKEDEKFLDRIVIEHGLRGDYRTLDPDDDKSQEVYGWHYFGSNMGDFLLGVESDQFDEPKNRAPFIVTDEAGQIFVMEHEYSDFYGTELYKRDFDAVVIGHTHAPGIHPFTRYGKKFYIMDCGSWYNYPHRGEINRQFGVIYRDKMVIYQYLGANK